MQLDSDVKPKSLALNTFKACTKNGCNAGPGGVIGRFVSNFTSSPINTLIPAALGEGREPPCPVAPTPCPSPETLQELFSHVAFAAKLGRSDKWEKSTLCHLTAKEMEVESSQGITTEDGEADRGCLLKPSALRASPHASW